MKRFSATRIRSSRSAVTHLRSSDHVPYLLWDSRGNEPPLLAVIHVDQKNRSVTVHWLPSFSHKMGHSQASFEQAFAVTDATVYEHGSWENLAKGVTVRITGHSNMIENASI